MSLQFQNNIRLCCECSVSKLVTLQHFKQGLVCRLLVCKFEKKSLQNLVFNQRHYRHILTCTKHARTAQPGEGVVGAGNEASNGATATGRVVVGVNTHHHQVLHLESEMGDEQSSRKLFRVILLLDTCRFGLLPPDPHCPQKRKENGLVWVPSDWEST